MTLTPSTFNLPQKFTRFRDGQFTTAYNLSQSPTRATLVEALTGSGKSLTTITASKLLSMVAKGTNSPTPHRTMYLVGNKGLQRQLRDEFESINLKNVWGKSNYKCPDIGGKGRAHEGKCNWGRPCSFKSTLDTPNLGCPYYDAILDVYHSTLGSSNYSQWMSIARYSNTEDKFGQFNLLILDEAHTIERWLADFCQVEFLKDDLEWMLKVEGMGIGNTIQGRPFSRQPPYDIDTNSTQGPIACIEWAKIAYDIARIKWQEVSSQPNPSRQLLFQLSQFGRDLKTIASITNPTNWVVDGTSSKGAVKFSPIWVSGFVEPYIFQGIPRIILSTAWLPPGHVNRLGLNKTTVDSDGNAQPTLSRIVVPSTFPPHHRPFTYIPTINITFKTFKNPNTINKLVKLFDDYIEPRIVLGRNGIIHTPSYKLAKAIYDRSRFGELMMMNNTSSQLEPTLKAFKQQSDKVKVLVTPSVVAGYDFPGDECRWQIIAKTPYLSFGDPLVQARNKSVPTYAVEEAGLTVLQMVGRPNRSEDDWCETVCYDLTFKRVYQYLKQNAPFSFVEAMRWSDYVPQPLKVAT